MLLGSLALDQFLWVGVRERERETEKERKSSLEHNEEEDVRED